MSDFTEKFEKFNSWSHFTGFAIYLALVPWLIVHASFTGSPYKIVSVSIYSASLLMLFFFSGFYHAMRSPGPRTLWMRFDHMGIYLLIAGTYTPFLLVTISGAWGWSLFGVVWGLAVGGIVLKSMIIHRFLKISTLLYVIMGWLVLLAVKPLVQNLPRDGLELLVIGGALYSIGAIFFILGERFHFWHTIWHLMVLVASLFHFATVYYYVV